MARSKIIIKQKTDVSKQNKKVVKQPKSNPQDKLFSLKKLQDQKLVLVEFPQIRVQKRRKAIGIPKFRLDRLHFTPGFCLPDQFNREYTETQKMIHESRTKAEITEIDLQNIQLARPSQRSSYCIICKVKFQNYREHIQQIQHINKMKNSYYNKFIQQLCYQYKMQKFFRDDCNKEEIIVQQKTPYSPKVFLDEQSQSKELKNNNVTKQDLYERVREQYRNQFHQNVRQLRTQQLPQQDIFDVLQC